MYNYNVVPLVFQCLFSYPVSESLYIGLYPPWRPRTYGACMALSYPPVSLYLFMNLFIYLIFGVLEGICFV